MITNKLLDELQQIIETDGVGQANAKTSGQLAGILSIQDNATNSKTREAIRILVEERGVPIASTSNGYFRISDSAEFWTYQEQLEGRIDGIEQRKQLVAEAWSGGAETEEIRR